MKKSNELTLKEAIEQLLKAYHIKDKFMENDVITHWEELMGKMIANRTTEIYIRDKKLFLRLNSAVLKSELLMMKSSLMQRINEHAGTVIVEEIVFL
jgi:predicted nucleic acid-binding Zn ribbon protein